jgi:hydrogenase small subunit
MERRRSGSSPTAVDPVAAPRERPGSSAMRELDRRSLLRWSAGMAALLALPTVPYAAQIAQAVTTKPRLPVLWLNGQDCTGDIESFLRSAKAAPTDLFLNQLSLDYSELLMAGAGDAAEKSAADTMSAYAGKYVLVVEGSIPTAQNGIFCTVGGRSFTSVLRTAAAGALAVIAVGTCAAHGGLPAAAGGSTGAAGVASVLGTSSVPLISLPGCPVNGDVITATLINYITLGTWPALDSKGRPTFAYGRTVHSRCERRTFFQAGKFVLAWGDAGHQAGWCLKQMGCQGQTTYNNCPVQKWNGGTSWPVGSGAPCLGCSENGFWD